MESYQNDIESKILVDEVQINFQCCGNQDYSDWFKVDWTGSAVVMGKEYASIKKP